MSQDDLISLGQLLAHLTVEVYQLHGKGKGNDGRKLDHCDETGMYSSDPASQEIGSMPEQDWKVSGLGMPGSYQEYTTYSVSLEQGLEGTSILTSPSISLNFRVIEGCTDWPWTLTRNRITCPQWSRCLPDAIRNSPPLSVSRYLRNPSWTINIGRTVTMLWGYCIKASY